MRGIPQFRAMGATVQAFRRSHWASWMFDVDSVAAGPDGVQTVKFGRGGYQVREQQLRGLGN